MLFITYSNTFSYSLNSIEYEFKAVQILNTKFKVVEPVFTKHPEQRILYNRHGIRVLFIQCTLRIERFAHRTLRIERFAH